MFSLFAAWVVAGVVCLFDVFIWVIACCDALLSVIMDIYFC